jgi:hypothetical protein
MAKFDSRINSWRYLVWESGATPNRCTYPHFLSNLVGLGQSHLALNQSQITLNELLQDEMEHSATSPG